MDNRYITIENKFDFDGIEFPIPIKQITKLEYRNARVSGNVYGINDRNAIYPLRFCEKEKKNHFDLLFLQNSNGVSHYCYIKNFTKLILSQKTKNAHKAVFCKRCFQHYQGKKKLVKLAEH